MSTSITIPKQYIIKKIADDQYIVDLSNIKMEYHDPIVDYILNNICDMKKIILKKTVVDTILYVFINDVVNQSTPSDYKPPEYIPSDYKYALLIFNTTDRVNQINKLLAMEQNENMFNTKMIIIITIAIILISIILSVCGYLIIKNKK